MTSLLSIVVLKMDRQPLSLWTYAAAESMFLYYFIGALALVFFITVFITKALRRKKVSKTLYASDNNMFTCETLLIISEACEL